MKFILTILILLVLIPVGDYMIPRYENVTMICTNLLSHYWDGSRNGCHTPNLFDKIISSKCKNVTYTAKVPITKAEYIANKEDSTYHVSGIQLYYEDGSCLKNNYYRTVEGTQVVCAATYRRQTKEAFSFK